MAKLTDEQKLLGLKIATTCERCRAYDVTHRPNGCTLGYNNVGSYVARFGIHRIEPQEPCPKPLTIEALFIARRAGAS